MSDRTSEKRFFTLKEAARYLGVAPHTVARWAVLGRLTTTTTGDDVLFERADLDAVGVRFGQESD